ncbi:MAG TPA: FKBP-type peptidyl-prolyl cis-trans isomerase [Chitinophagaceae bacterium]|nr:FKBP-type peptidyl-prolyl cis-trans isomerase [Chitinophagaceae bacterium]
MKNILLCVIFLSAFSVSCSKKDDACNFNDSNVVAPASEVANVQAYLTANSIIATQHSSGFFYKITQTGSGQSVVNLCSKINIKYTGKLTNGTVFDQTAAGASANFTLGQLIVGWQKGIPLISSGGKITLYIPPSLGYGSSPTGTIPANSILIFDIELIGVS